MSVTAPPIAAPATDRAEPQERGAAALVAASILVATVGSLFSAKLGGRFALSNVAQIVALLLLLRAYPRLLRSRDVAALVIAAAGVLVAAIAVSSIYGYQIVVSHSLFFALAATYLIAVYRACSEHGAKESFALGLRRAIPLALAVLLVMLALDLGTGNPKRRLSFDDKSHASVMACFLAFAALRFLDSRRRLVYALAFFTVSLLTISRLPFAFAPAFVVAMLIEYRKVRAAATTPWEVYGAHVVLGIVLVAPVLLARQAGNLFTVFDRILAAGGNTDASTRAHLLLLDFAAQLKVDNVWNLVFGVTPGGFSGVTARSGIDISEYASIDPPGYEKFAVGAAPMHSSLGSILLEFPLWVAVAYLGLVCWSLVRLVAQHEFVLALFLVSFVAATTFYSSHNELYFYVVWAAVIAVATVPRSVRERHRAELAASSP